MTESQWIGVLRGVLSKRIYAVINPDDDVQLDNPRFLLIQNEEMEPVRLIRIPREDYMTATSMDDVARLSDARDLP
jgi:hypothetical protein